jgi:hypothetical protein
MVPAAIDGSWISVDYVVDYDVDRLVRAEGFGRLKEVDRAASQKRRASKRSEAAARRKQRVGAPTRKPRVVRRFADMGV